MALLKILRFPNENLRIKAEPVSQINGNVRVIINDMLETMYEANGVGLAATQVDIHQRIVVIDVSEGRNEPMVLVNPEIIHKEGTQIYEEGCLSIPACYAKIERAEKITFTAQKASGEHFTQDAEGLLAVCVQHEIDHLEGKLFVDYLSPLKRDRIKKKLEKEARIEAQEAKK